jgi:hypothetical protein
LNSFNSIRQNNFMGHRIKSALGVAAAAAIISATTVSAQTPASDTIRSGDPQD